MSKSNVAEPVLEKSAVDLERPRPSSPPLHTAGKGAPNVRREITENGICILTFDRPGSSANVFDHATLAELNEHLDSIASSSLAGLVLFSAKPSIFIAGADLHTIASETNQNELCKLIQLGQAVFNRIAALPLTSVAAIHGACVGGGCEIALACDWRVASDDRATRIGLPETQIGLIPAWGGSTRLPRLIGLPKALGAILAGKTYPAKPALKLGMVDAVVPREYVLQTALNTVRKGKPHRARHSLANNFLVAAALTPYLRRQLRSKTRGHYPAVEKALEVAAKGVTRSVTESLRLEVDGIMELAQSPATRNLIQLFFLQERAKKLKAGRSASAEPAKRITRCAVIGAGVMGSGIAQWLSARKVSVILRDINPEQVARGMANISKLYRDGTKRHVFTPTEARAGLDRIQPATGSVPLRNADLVIEAAVEDMKLKKEIFQKLEADAGEHTILATNTSALSVSELAASTSRPERVVGIHFFNPVHRMQLVEVVRGRQTSPAAVEAAIQFVQQIGKLPLLVNDSPGFLVNRILVPYLIEAGLLFEAGARIEDIDEAMLEFGMPMGPLRLLDEVGLDVAHHISGTLSEKFGDRFRIPQLLERMVKSGALGKKTGRGFYLHGRSKKSSVNAEATALQASDAARMLTRPELQERMVLLMVNEAARCLEEKVVAEPEDVDFGMVMGTGFAPFRGGPLRYADSVGAVKLVSSMRCWVNAGVKYLEPAASLQTMANHRQRFYLTTGGAV